MGASVNGVSGRIMQVEYYVTYNAVLLVDDKGSCGVWYVEEDNDVKIGNMIIKWLCMGILGVCG